MQKKYSEGRENPLYCIYTIKRSKFMEKVVIVTGATSGYGLATAKKFKENGWIVVAASRNKEKVDACAKIYGFNGYVLDVTDYSQWLDF